MVPWWASRAAHACPWPPGRPGPTASTTAANSSLAQLCLTTLPGDTKGLGRLHVAAHRLAVDPSGVSYPAQPFSAAKPPAQYFSYLDH